MFQSLLRFAAIALILSWVAAVADQQAAETAESEPTEITEIDANEAEQARSDEEDEEETIADDIVLETQNCISSSRIRRTDILDDHTIVFYMYGSDIFLNKLPHRCSGLRMADAFGYDVRTSQLCNVDTIRVLDNFGGGIRPGIACGLGKFGLITEEQLTAIRDKESAEE